MPEFENDGAAAAALAAANLGEVAPPEVAPVEQAPVAEASAVETGTNLSESSTFDINSVPEELRPQVQELLDGSMRQADYTRKTQEIAPIRSLIEQSGMSVEDAQQALAFAQSLNDPAALQDLYTKLQDHFGNETETEDAGNVDPRDRQIGDLSSRLERFEKAQAMTQAETALTTATTAVKESYPDFESEDMTRVEQLAIAQMQGGKDVHTAMADAAKEYKSWEDAKIARYIANKGNVAATGGKPLVGGTHAQTPETFKNLDDATKAAMAAFGQDWVN